MNSIPLVRNNSVNDINTSLIALRKVLRELTETTSDVNKEIEKYVLKSDVVNVVESGNDNPVTSGAVYDKVTDTINSLDVPSVGGSGKYISAISETNGKISATASDIDTTVTSGSNNPITSGGVAYAISNEVSARDTAIANAIDIPKDAVLHYSFDDVPDLPDGSSIYKKNNDWVSSDLSLWSGNATKSISNNKLKISGSSVNNLYTITDTYSSGTIIIVKGIAILDGVIEIRNSQNNLDTTLKSVTVYANKNFEVYIPITTQGKNIIFRGISTEWDIEISGLYLGTGSYITPIIDNSGNGINAVNNGGIATKGVSGKGAYFLEGENVAISNFNLTSNFSVSFWVNPINNTTGLSDIILGKTDQIIIRNGASWTDSLILYLYGDTSTLLNGVGLGAMFTPNQWSHLVIAREGVTLKVYRNGVLTNTFSLADTTLKQNNNVFYLSHSSTQRPRTFDDFQIFNRALSAKEVQSLYLNKANTPKYYNVNNYKLPSPPSADGTYNLQCTISSGVATYSWVGSGNRSLPETKGGDEETEEEKPIEEPKEEER